MDNYNFIYDIPELHKFWTRIVQELKDFEVLFISLSCRKKYLTAEEREEFHITRAEMFDRKLVRINSFERFLRTIRKYEVSKGGYLTKNGLPVPAHCMTIYFNINPSNSLKALKEFNSKIIDWQYEITAGNKEGYSKKFNKLDIELMNCYQRSRGSKHWIDIDLDVPQFFKAPKVMKSYLESLNIRYFWIDTRSGYHLLIDRDTLKFNPDEICTYGIQELYKEICELSETDKSKFPVNWSGHDIFTGDGMSYEIIVNKNEMIPLPGCLQGGYPVSVLWEYSS